MKETVRILRAYNLLLAVCFIAALLITPLGIAVAQEAKVPAEVWEKAQIAGTVLVVVGLKAPWQPEGRLSKEVVVAQRQAIAAAQSYLLTELAGTKYRITRQYENIPGIALEVGSDALAVLEKSAAVVNVIQDRPARPSPEQGAAEKTP